MKRQAFTLLELLVVISIIVVLAGMITAAAFYAFGRVNEVKCQNNIRQLALAIQSFATGNQSRLPPPCKAADMPGRYERGWLYKEGEGADEGLLVRHEMVGSPEIFLCPTHMDDWELERVEEDEIYWEPATEELDGEKHQLVSGRVYSSYSMNELTWQGSSPRLWEDFSKRHFLLVEESVLQGESRYNDGAIEPSASDLITGRHQGGGHVACFDGHVEYLTQEEYEEIRQDTRQKKRRWVPVPDW